jgi:hypothetical protein
MYNEPRLSPVSTRTRRVPADLELQRARVHPLADVPPALTRSSPRGRGRLTRSTPGACTLTRRSSGVVDAVWLHSVRANVTELCAGGRGLYHDRPEADVNTLFSGDYLDPISGFPGYKASLCAVKRPRLQPRKHRR